MYSIHLVHGEYLVVQLLSHQNGMEVGQPGQEMLIAVPEFNVKKIYLLKYC